MAIFDAGSFAAGSLVAMVTAVAGCGPWALVLGYLVEESLSMVCYLVASPPKVSLRIDGPRLRESFSLAVFGHETESSRDAILRMGTLDRPLVVALASAALSIHIGHWRLSACLGARRFGNLELGC